MATTTRTTSLRRTRGSEPTTNAAEPAPAKRRTQAASAARATGTSARKRGGGAARNLVIVESPAKARTVGNILGDDYRVIASVGHVRDLPAYGYGLEDFDTFKPKYVVVKDKRRGVDKSDVINEIAEAARGAERIYLSTDPDREGEAISWHIREAAGIPVEKSRRVVFHEITRPAIEEAFEHPGELNQNLVDAQQTRRVLDRLIGFPLTWFVQGKVSRSASAGRVQSVALRLIVERERLIREFRAQEYWSIHALVAKGDSAFATDLVRIPGMRRGMSLKPGTGDFVPAIPDEASASALTARFNRSTFRVTSVKKGERAKSPVPPFTTSTFQQAAVNRLGMSAARAMDIAQQLYEGVNVPGAGPVGLITYMRTDSLNVSPLARGAAREYIGRRWGADYVPAKERVYRTRARGAQEAHEAIRPTEGARSPESLQGALDRDQMRVYRLIWQRFMASQMADARFATAQIDVTATDESGASAVDAGVFRASAQRLLFPGHLAVYGTDVNEREQGEEDEDAESTLPELNEGDVLERRAVEQRQHFTEPPPRYTEASLVKALEEKGIGRPSTYATIVQTVLKRDYVAKQGRALVPQELGFLVNDLLVQHVNRYVNVDFTSEMEEELDDVAEGKRSYLGVVKEFWSEFEKNVAVAKDSAEKVQEETDFVCDVCGQAKMVIKWGRNGKFMACPRFPDCKNAKPLTEEGQPAMVSGPTPTSYRCPKDGGVLIQKSGPFGPYVDCENRETGACDFRAGVPVGVRCPEEPETGQLVEKRTRRGVFYGCWNYPRCSYTANTLDRDKMPPARPEAEREEANRKLLERSARGKAAFAARRAKAPARRAG